MLLPKSVDLGFEVSLGIRLFMLRWLIAAIHFLHKSSRISGYFVERELKDASSYVSWPPCISARKCNCMYVLVYQRLSADVCSMAGAGRENRERQRGR